MSQRTDKLTVLGRKIIFRAGADMKRAKLAATLVEEKYADHELKSQGSQSKDILLTFLALGLADELLQMKIKQDQTQSRLQTLIAKIENSR